MEENKSLIMKGRKSVSLVNNKANTNGINKLLISYCSFFF